MTADARRKDFFLGKTSKDVGLDFFTVSSLVHCLKKALDTRHITLDLHGLPVHDVILECSFQDGEHALKSFILVVSEVEEHDVVQRDAKAASFLFSVAQRQILVGAIMNS